MPSQRTFETTLLGAAFDPAVFVPQTGWSPSGTQLANQMRLEAEDRMGRYSPEVLGRGGKLFALAFVWCNGPIAEGDQVQVLSSANTADGQPVDVVRRVVELTTSPATAQVLLLGPTDDIGVSFAGDGTAATVHIMVNDLEEGELFAWLAANPSTGSCCATVTRSVAGESTTLDPWTGHLYVHAAMDSGVEVTLPASGDLAVGASAFIAREGGGPFFVRADGTDTINGAPVGEGIQLDGNFSGILFELSAGGRWLASEGVNSAVTSVDNAVAGASVPLPAWAGDRATSLRFTAYGTLVLPSLVDIGLGQRHLLFRDSGQAQITIEAPFPARINGVIGGTSYLEGEGSAVWVERVESGWSVVASHELAVFNLPQDFDADATLERWAGDLTINLAAAGDVTVTLPAVADVPDGSRLFVTRNGGSGRHRIQAQAGESVNSSPSGGVNLTLNNGAVTIVQVGGQWVATVPIVADESTVVNAPTVLTAGWTGLRCFTMDAAVALTLPAGAALRLGQQALIWPAIAGSTITATPELISYGGVQGASITPGIEDPVLLTWNGTLWCGV